MSKDHSEKQSLKKGMDFRKCKSKLEENGKRAVDRYHVMGRFFRD